MSQLNLKTDQSISSLEDFTFEPIKGYPMLHWKGKRPFRSTQYYPAQLKEVHGQPADGWLNKIFWGDNLQVMSHLLKNYRGQVDLVYIDPPFDSKADYKKKISLKGQTAENDASAFEEKQYTDIWSNDEYLQFMYERLVLIRELLSESGSIYMHCDGNKVHLLRCLLDEIFGENNFRSFIIREKCNPKNYTSQTYGNISDHILFYSKTMSSTWNILYTEFSEEDIELSFPKIAPDGRRYKTAPLHAPGERSGETGKPWRNIPPPSGNHWRYIHKTLDKLDEEGLIEWSSTGNPRKIIYANESKGVPVQDIWLKFKDTSGIYPTQKPETLLERIIKSSSNPSDLVFDCFMGSGTTQAVAMKLGRRFIGADINLGAIQTTTKRLLGIAEQLRARQQKEEWQLSLVADPAASYGQEEDAAPEKPIAAYYTGFEVYNVNHYDVFRNPLEAKELLIKALEIQPMPGHALYDGEKDGRMVKIMPVNRIATRADLNELITGFDYKVFEKRNEANPGKPVEHLTLVCMGHEPDLGAFLKENMKASGFTLEVDVVDILRDKSNLEFKREAEADIALEDGQVRIRQFYPMNLLQKLSLMKENVEDWRELVESVMVDFNYDGAVFEPAVVDVPSGDALVKGAYPIPAGAGTIKVKITDLLSESLEMELRHG